ncbi:MAG TPA: hypothetical protein VJ889_08705 [Pseudomonas sp.]|nr:hypothetical protein [Pseudomonas sp.]
MKLTFPTMAYKTPGTHHCAGGTYDYISADSAERLDQLLEDGWFLSLPEAIAGEHDDSRFDDDSDEDAPESPVDSPSATEVIRAWLSGKLNDVGIEHDEDMGEDELLFLICHEFAKPAEPEPEPEPENDDSSGDDVNPPTRIELETEAASLGIKFDGRTTDKLLAEKIEFVHSEREGE